MLQTLRPTRFAPLFLLAVLLAATAQPAQAQLSSVRLRLHGGIVQPLALGSEYFSFGPSAAVDAAYPLSDRLDLVLDLGWDYLNTDRYKPTPVTNLWRYRAELETALVGGGDDDGMSVRAFAGVGATTFRSHKFWLLSRRPYTFDGERIRGTALTGTGGLRLGLPTPDGVTWWLSGKLNWTPINDSNSDALRELSTDQATPNGFDPISSMLGASITLGLSL